MVYYFQSVSCVGVFLPGRVLTNGLFTDIGDTVIDEEPEAPDYRSCSPRRLYELALRFENQEKQKGGCHEKFCSTG